MGHRAGGPAGPRPLRLRTAGRARHRRRAEESGTMTNLEGRVLLRRQAVAPPSGVRSDLEILRGLAVRLRGAEGFSTDPREVFDELRRASAGGIADYAGITYERIVAE